MVLRVRPSGAPWAFALVLILGGASTARTAAAQGDLLQELKTIHRVRLVGRHQLSDGELRAVLKTRSRGAFPWSERPSLRVDFLRADTSAIRSYYRHFGFLEASSTWRLVPRNEPDVVDVEFLIDEGPRTRIRAVTIETVRRDLEPALRKRLYARPKRPFDPAYLALDTLVISSLYQDHGYRPHAEGAARRDSAAGLVDVYYTVHEGPLYRVGDVYASGYRTVPERLVRRELLLKSGDLYSRDKVIRSQERLYETGLFDQVQITTLPDSTQTLVEYDLRVRERKPHWVDASIGSGTTEALRFTGVWGSRNLFRRGMQSAVTGLVALYDDASFQRFHVDYSLVEPWLFHTRTRGSISPFYELYDDQADPRVILHQQFVGINFGLHRDLNRWTKVALTLSNSFVQQHVQFRTVVDPVVQDSIKAAVRPDYRVHRLQLAFERDTRDNPLLTTRGSAQYLTGQIAGGPLQGSSNFTKIEFVPSWYTPLRNVIFATRMRAGVIHPFNVQTAILPDQDPEVASVPLEDRFRTGGVNSIRGYTENAIPSNGGLAVLQATVELRAPLAPLGRFGSLGLEAFVDAGNAWAHPSDIRLDQMGPNVSDAPLGPNDVRWVFGIGPRLETPIGPLRLDISWSLRPSTGRGALVPVRQFALGPSF